MQFIWPTVLLSLILVPVLVGVYIWLQRRRRRYAVRYASLSLVRDAMGNAPGRRRHVPPALFLLAVAFMLVAAARPQMVVAVPAQEGTVILAIDVSGSMQATDVQPNRMEGHIQWRENEGSIGASGFPSIPGSVMASLVSQARA